MVLQSDVAVYRTIPLEIRDHRLAVQRHVVNLFFDANYKCVPLARMFGGDLHRRLHTVDGASLVNHVAVRRAFIVDLDFVALLDRDSWIAARIIGKCRLGKADEDTRVVALFRDLPVYLELEVSELPGRMPEETQAAFGHEHSVFDPEPARAGLPPAVEVGAVEELDGLARRFGERVFKHKAILGVALSPLTFSCSIS